MLNFGSLIIAFCLLFASAHCGSNTLVHPIARPKLTIDLPKTYMPGKLITPTLKRYLLDLIEQALNPALPETASAKKSELERVLHERRLTHRTFLTDDGRFQPVGDALVDFASIHHERTTPPQLRSVLSVIEEKCPSPGRAYSPPPPSPLTCERILAEAKQSSWRKADSRLFLIPLPTLDQMNKIGEKLYAGKSENWDSSCGFYSLFHITTLQDTIADPFRYFDAVTRTNFNTFLGIIRSSREYAETEPAPEDDDDTHVVESYRRRQAILRRAHTIPLGFLYGHSDEQLLHEAYRIMQPSRTQRPTCSINATNRKSIHYNYFFDETYEIESLHHRAQLKRMFSKTQCSLFAIMYYKSHLIPILIIKQNNPADESSSDYMVFYGNSDHNKDHIGNLDFKDEIFAVIKDLTDSISFTTHVFDELDFGKLAVLLNSTKTARKHYYEPKRKSYDLTPGDALILNNHNIMHACFINDAPSLAAIKRLSLGLFMDNRYDLFGICIFMHHYDLAEEILDYLVKNDFSLYAQSTPSDRIGEFAVHLAAQEKYSEAHMLLADNHVSLDKVIKRLLKNGIYDDEAIAAIGRLNDYIKAIGD